MKTLVTILRASQWASLGRSLYRSFSLFFGMTVSLSIASAAYAATNDEPTYEPTYLPSLVVTASRIDTRADNSVSDVVVLGPAELARYDNRTLPEVLQRAAGIDFSSNGGMGQISSLRIRGSKSEHVLLLLDGVRYGSAASGLATWDSLPLTSIERIEIIKGPASSLYGSDAVGGVVQVFTRKGATGVHPYVSLGVGTDEQRKLNVGVSASEGALRYQVNVATQEKNEVSATNAKNTFGFNPDRDPFRNDSIDASLDYAVNQNWSVNARALNSAGVARVDNGLTSFDTRSEIGAQVYSVGVKGQLTSDWKTQILIGQSIDKNVFIETSKAGITTSSPTHTTQQQYSWQNQIVTPIGIALVGAEHLAQSINSTTAYDLSSRAIDAVFVGLNGEQGKHTWQANLRRDSNSQFGQSTSGFAGYGYALTPAWRVQTSYGTSFRAPSFNDLYYPGFSNPNLLPETGRSYDAGVTWKDDMQNAKIVYFSNEVKDLIVFDNDRPNNIALAKTTGWTAEYGVTKGDLSATIGAQLIDARDQTTQKELARVAPEQYRASVNYRIEKWLFGASLLHSGRRFDDGANTAWLDGFSTADMSLSYALSPDWTVRGQIDNIADSDYSTALGYNQARRNALLSVRWAPR